MKYKKLIISLASLIVFGLFAQVSFAQIPPAGGGGNIDGGGGTGVQQPSSFVKLKNPLKVGNIRDLLFKVVRFAIFIGAMFAVLAFLMVGFKFITARGDSAALTDAKRWFFYAVIGTTILISSQLVVDVIQNTLTSSGLVDKSIFNGN